MRTERPRRHRLFARFYQWAGPAMDRGGMAEHRARLLTGLSGRVIEVGAGAGLNFAHYPATVTGVLAVEPEPSLRSAAEHAAASAPIRVEVVDGSAERLPGKDGAFDAAVASLVLCSVPDPARALAELHRVIRPGGEFRFLEHVRADTAGLRRAQRIADGTLWPLLVGGCHTGRDTVGAIQSAGFLIASLERFRFPDSGPPLPASPHILGSAQRPAATDPAQPERPA